MRGMGDWPQFRAQATERFRGDIRGKIGRQPPSGGRLDGGENVGRPASVEPAHRARGGQRHADPAKRSAESAAAAIGSLSTSTPLQSKMTNGPSDGFDREARPSSDFPGKCNIKIAFGAIMQRVSMRPVCNYARRNSTGQRNTF